VLNDGYWDQAVELIGKHAPAGKLRGGKGSLYEGGTRVPFMIRWPENIQQGRSDAIVCHIDFLASFAHLLGLPIEEIYDSQNVSEALLGKVETGRSTILLEGVMNLAIRQGDWVMIPPYEGEAVQKTTGTEMGRSEVYQLYDLNSEIGQQANLAEKYPERVQDMKTELEKITGTDITFSNN
jgi:arylsulfatase A-like enzyme